MVRVTFSPPSDWTLLGSILGVEVKQEYGHVTGIPQEKDENDGSAANQSPAREDGITIHKCHRAQDFQMRNEDGCRMFGSAQERKLGIKGMFLCSKAQHL